MDTDVMSFLLGAFAILALGIVNYVLKALAIYKVAKVEKVDNPWLAWIPIANSFLIIKLGKGKMYLLVLSIMSFIADGYMASFSVSGVTKGILIGVILIWLLYELVLYNRICDSYDVSVILIACSVVAFLFKYSETLASLYIPLMLLSLYGHWRLYRNASKDRTGKLKVESRVTFSSKKKK